MIAQIMEFQGEADEIDLEIRDVRERMALPLGLVRLSIILFLISRALYQIFG